MRRAGGVVVVVACAFLLGAAARVEGGQWRRAFVRTLPDDAFAIVETGPDGRRQRHLPHHGADGQVDAAHLRSALSRLHQVKWADPADAERAHQHLLEHLAGLRTRGIGERGVPGDSLTPGRGD